MPLETSEEAKTVTIEEAQKLLTDELMKLAGVVGTGIGLCGEDPCIKVYLANNTTELTEKIPASYRGYAVAVQISGEVTARPPDS